MAPLPLPLVLNNKQPGEKILEIAGNLKVTGLKMNASEFKNGSISVYKNTKNEFTCHITASQRPTKSLKLTKNIKTIKFNDDRLTVVLGDQVQILGSLFLPDQLKTLATLFHNIQDGKIKDVLSSSSSKSINNRTQKTALPEDSKENLHRRSPQPARNSTSIHTPKRTPLTEQDRPSSVLSSAISETPSRSSFLRDQSNSPRQKLLSPFSKRSSPQNNEGTACKEDKSPEFDTKQNDNSKIKTGSFYGGSTSLSSFMPNKYSSESKPRSRTFDWGSPQPKGKLSNLITYSMRDRQRNIWSGFNSSAQLTGFSNLGNTCYMNAILQCLLGMPTFAHDLGNKEVLNNAPSSGLYRCLYNLLLSKKFEKGLEKQRSTLKEIKKAISLAATRFSGYSQHDAHEFLGQCLDQLKDDVNKIVNSRKVEEDDAVVKVEETNEDKEAKENVCPVGRNFECGILHTIQCTSCKETITKEEVFHDFSLDIPEIDENTNPNDSSLQDLLWSYFEDESVEYTCEKCGCGDAVLAHHFSRLPRIIILHLKRYGYNVDLSKNNKKLDKVDIPKDINLGILCTENTLNPVSFRRRNERSPTKVAKRIVSDEFSPDDLEDDFQPSIKIRRKLDLPPDRLTSESTPSKEQLNSSSDKTKSESGFDPLKLSEEEQIMWALEESSRTYGLETPKAVNVRESKRKNRVKISPDLLEISEAFAMDVDELESNDSASKEVNRSDDDSTRQSDDDNPRQSYTRLRTPNEKEDIKTIIGSDKDKNQSKEDVEIDWLSSDENAEKEKHMYSTADVDEPVDILDDEDEQLKMALEISLQEYNTVATPEHNKYKSSPAQKRRTSYEKHKQALMSSNLPPKKYRLTGIVSHVGDKANSGHYVCDVYNCKAQQWKSYNDTAVKDVSEYEVRYGRKDCSYIFFYVNEDSFKTICPASEETS